jgi:curved DNA-binding protein CbpA
MGICKCGKKSGGSGKQCRRCATLNELGLKAGASEASIKSAYRLLVKKWHPDVQGKSKVRQLAAEERTKRLNIAYKFLTAPPKKGVAPSPPRSPATPEKPSRPPSSTTSKSSKGQAARSTTSPERTSLKQQPITSSADSTKHPRRSRKAIPNYPKLEFTPWKSAFDSQPINGTKAGNGLKKWISNEAARRASAIAFAVSSWKEYGFEPDLKGYSLPKDAKVDVLKRLWGGSVPNVVERSKAVKSDNELVKQMNKTKKSVEKLASEIKQRNAKLATQDGGFIVSLNDMRESCIRLSTYIATASALVKREYIQPLKLADCFVELVYELEEIHRLSQAECHALIQSSLIAHGFALEQATPFDADSVDRGTIRAKKEALTKKVLDSVNIMAQVIQNS